MKLPYSTQYIDDKVGELVRALEVTGEGENRIILFVSDHGEMLGNGAYGGTLGE
ncbi:MAG: sulfatase-like hydrolase/transferase [Ardenticatenaceae bacterium]